MKRTFVLFNAKQSVYGIEINKVVSIERFSEATSIPQASDYIIGVVNIRGGIVPVVDSHFLLYHEHLQANEETRYILLEVQGSNVAFMVENTNEIIDIDDDVIKPVGMIEGSRFVEGVSLIGGRIISILNSEGMISSMKGFKDFTKDDAIII